MKAVILAGGFGTRLSEETDFIPKPMVRIGERPILWHIMKLYSHYGINDFVLCLGYKSEVIKDYFANYLLHTHNVTVDVAAQKIEIHPGKAEPWRITMVETGLHSLTAGRIKQVKPFVGTEPFCLTYGDGLSNVDIGKLIAFHKAHGKKATVTAISQQSRFGVLDLDKDKVARIREKPNDGGTFINGGFFVLDPSVCDLVTSDDIVWEQEPLEQLSESGNLMAYRHQGFWQPMDTLRDKRMLEEMWNTGNAPWKVWKD